MKSLEGITPKLPEPKTNKLKMGKPFKKRVKVKRLK